ncbi:hypothetical protein X777_12671 [Ooceraea biroi]|uniref:THAP-type domain-containing protein n=1 Tax=Ooceraea biroi TaxID=2015173 RepID=A0A026W201_OOCBI|nr:hypothetical protein X777_12671 [Ooceraea biroi]
MKACKRNERDININTARICSLHFQDECFEMQWTKPRAKKINLETVVPARQIRRLKMNSVPSLFLDVEKKKRIKAK